MASSLAVDESSDIRGDSSLNVTEEFLALRPVHGTTTGQDLYEEVSRCGNEMELPREKLNPSVPGDYLSPSGENLGSNYVPSSSTHFDDDEEEQAPFNSAPEDAPEDVDATEGHKESVSKKEEEVAKCQPPRSKKRKNQASDMDEEVDISNKQASTAGVMVLNVAKRSTETAALDPSKDTEKTDVPKKKKKKSKHLSAYPPLHSLLQRKEEKNITEDSDEEDNCLNDNSSVPEPSKLPADKHLPSYKQFLDYRNSKSNERQSYSYGGRHRAKERKHVQINIGTMVRHETFLKPLRGRTLPLFVDPDIEAPDILSKAVQKMRTFHQDTPEGTYVLLYPDCSEVIHVPGSERPFKLAEYKQELGRPYSRITFFICLERHFQAVESDSDSEIVLTSRSSAELNQADTVVFEPQNQSTPQNIPEHERDAPGHSSTIQPGQIVISDGESMDGPEANPATTSCYSNYTDLYAPDVEDMDEDLVAVDVENLEHTAVEEMNITLPDIVANLSLPIDHKRVSRFNISRANVWDGAVRGFKRTTYTEQCDMLVRFTDDAGFFEEGIDTGGPRREFLTLLMRHLKDRPIFDGPDGHRFLVYNAKAVREDEYFIAGKMIAVSVVHGGPGPHFLSEDLVQYLAGQPSFKSTVDAITDEEIRTVLREIENAASLDALQECIMRHSTVFQTAGCLRHLTSVEEKKDLVADYVRWYIIERNSSVIGRFKDGLSALQFLTTLQQHPSLLIPVLCHSEKRLTGIDIGRLFTPDVSLAGSNRRQKESLTLAYWADYLLDCQEGEAAVSLEEILMFATGLTSLPPSGLEPLPQIEFLDDSPFPMANTCSNLLKLPLLDSYSVFKAQMDFGIQNSPGFGCL